MNRVLVALVAALALAGCTADDPSSRESPSPTPTASATAEEVPEAPANGACHRLTVEEATAPTSDDEPVDCSKRHTARTVHVGRLTDLVKGRSPAVDSERVQRLLSRDCLTRFEQFIGGTPDTRRLSRFQVVWFSPALEEADAGADWFRCDVLAFGAADQLLPLPTDRRLRGVLDRQGALGTFGLCGTARPGSPQFDRVACGLRHSWVAISTIPIQGGERYPGTARVRGAGDEPCRDQVRDRNTTLLQFDYGWEWPTREQWRAGQRHGFCWAPADLA